MPVKHVPTLSYLQKGTVVKFLFMSFVFVAYLKTCYCVPNANQKMSKEVGKKNMFEDNSTKTYNESEPYKNLRLSNIIKRNLGRVTKCFSADDCAIVLPGSLCINGSCSCPPGYMQSDGGIGCFETGKKLGESCNITAQCGEGLSCQNKICLCPDGFQLFRSQGVNLCLYWQTKTHSVDRCRNNEDCIPHDANSLCFKRWCHCKNGYQLFETMTLYGLKHKCFKTSKMHCINSAQCANLAESSQQHCICYFGVCHCMPNHNSSLMDLHGWTNEKPTWYQRWKKDLILATRLLFITVILFFVPCFVYVTLGVRERSRQLFSQFVQPSRSTASHAHYARRRSSIFRAQPQGNASLTNPPVSEAHHVEITLNSRGVNSRLLGAPTRVSPLRPVSYDESISRESQRCRVTPSETTNKEEDSPPTYDEVMRIERMQEAPPPPYREL